MRNVIICVKDDRRRLTDYREVRGVEESLIEEFFGKKDDITKEDLENFLKGADESITLEFKEIRDPKQAKKLIIKSLVGFLNSVEGRGLLIVGVSDNKQIRGVAKAHLNKQKIRNWIRDDISAVPPAIARPYHHVVELKVEDDKAVYLIEIRREDNVVYFSRKFGCAYLREGDSTKRLDLSESLELIARKSLAEPYLELRVHDVVLEPALGLVSMRLDPILKNKGSKPALYLTIPIEFSGIKIIESKVEAPDTFSNIKKLNDSLFQITVGFPPNTVPIYPTKLGFSVNGNIALKFYPIPGITPKIIVRCYEREVLSYAEYEITPQILQKALQNPKEGVIMIPSKLIIKPYITLGS